MDIKKQLGQNVKIYRKANKMTQAKLAEQVGVEVISISSIETGRYFPTPENLVKIASALNISLSELFDFKQELECEDYLSQIHESLKIIADDRFKLYTINKFIKNTLTL